MMNFKDIYIRANNQIYGDRAILKREKKPVLFDRKKIAGLAAAIAVVAIGSYAYFGTEFAGEENIMMDNTVSEETHTFSAAARMEKVGKTPAVVSDICIHLVEGRCVKITENEVTIVTAENEERSFKITENTQIQDTSGNPITKDEIKPDTALAIGYESGSDEITSLIIRDFSVE